MASKLKNIIIFGGIGLFLVLIYVFLIKQDPEEDPLVSYSGGIPTQTTNTTSIGINSNQDFLPVLLNVRNIKLDTSIFADPAFGTLFDSTILLVPDGNEGRPNPFAPIGVDNLPALPASVSDAFPEGPDGPSSETGDPTINPTTSSNSNPNSNSTLGGSAVTANP